MGYHECYEINNNGHRASKTYFSLNAFRMRSTSSSRCMAEASRLRRRSKSAEEADGSAAASALEGDIGRFKKFPYNK